MVEELEGGELPPRRLASANAERKAFAVAEQFPGRVVLAADTVVALPEAVFGKPADSAEALSMLLRLAGRVHEVFTAVEIRRALPEGSPICCRFVETTRLRFRNFSKEEAAGYLSTIDPLDKAGAYSAQEDGGRLIDQLEGSMENVIGLPVDRVVEALRLHFSGVVALPGEC